MRMEVIEGVSGVASCQRAEPLWLLPGAVRQPLLFLAVEGAQALWHLVLAS